MEQLGLTSSFLTPQKFNLKSFPLVKLHMTALSQSQRVLSNLEAHPVGPGSAPVIAENMMRSKPGQEGRNFGFQTELPFSGNGARAAGRVSISRGQSNTW